MFTRHLINHSGAELLAGETVAAHFKIISHITMFHAADGFPVKPLFLRQTKRINLNTLKLVNWTVLCLEAQNNHRQIND